MSAHGHPFDRELSGVQLAQHLTRDHQYSSSNELENFNATHRQLHGVPSMQEEARQQLRAEAWNAGYDAGHYDAYGYQQAQAAGPSTAENWLAEGGTPNPYAAAAAAVPPAPLTDSTGACVCLCHESGPPDLHLDSGTCPCKPAPTNPDLWV